MPIRSGTQNRRCAVSSQHIARNKVTWRWLVGALFATVLSVVGYAFTSLNDRVVKLEDKSDKIPAFEVEIKHLNETMQRIEGKLDDELIAHGHYRPDLKTRGS